MKLENNITPNDNTMLEELVPKGLLYLFNEGKNFQCYNLLGAHEKIFCGKTGYLFTVWAPNARSVSVVGDFNGWDENFGVMTQMGTTGVWALFCETAKCGDKYKFSVLAKSGKRTLKADPFAFESEVRPDTASVIYKSNYSFNDSKWMEKRKKTPIYDKPLNIYELHFGSWKRKADGSFLSYAETAKELVPYVKELGYTHIELLPICEYPFDGSWGYQVTGYYSANSRFGSPDELKYFVDECHNAGLGVIMDWVPAHFPKDEHGLALFDGTPLFEHPDSRKGEHKEWGTLVFNWEKTEIHSFLISNAIFWFEQYHFDGLRVDAVSSMLYLDYNRNDGEWVKNSSGGNENLAAVEFLQKLNISVFERFPNVLMIAEESTAWPKVTKPVYDGGLGFNYKWNMGWMNDILRFMSTDPYFRGSNFDTLTFSMMYAYSENYILPLSHDEVVHGKKSLVDKMFGSYEQKFKSLKLLYAYMYAHPGKKLLFMGGEFGQFAEWKFAEGLDWLLFDYDSHKGIYEFVKELNGYYLSNKSMHENDSDWNGFGWINHEDKEKSVLSFKRISKSGRDKTFCVFNFAAADYKNYEIGVDSAGEYEIVLNTEDEKYGGSGKNSSVLKAKAVKDKSYKYAVYVDLKELSGLYIKKRSTKRLSGKSKKN